MTEALNLIYPDWPAPPSVRAAVTTRVGGVSRAPWQSLNLATHVGDAEVAVHENRRRLKAALALPKEPLWLEQVHGVRVVDAATALQGTQADAVMASRVGLVCTVMTADCLPVLFCDQAGRRVAAAHAGWRGLLNGVLEATIKSMGLPAHQLMAWLGPAIGPQAFEVGQEVRDAFLKADTDCADAFLQGSNADHYQADLYALAKRRLIGCGLNAISGGEYCSFSDAERFFSYRRDGQCGRMASLIWLSD